MGAVEPPVLNVDRPDWMTKGACVGEPADLFFPGPGRDGAVKTKKAKQICRTCPVVNDCIMYAMTFAPRSLIGIWGGTTERERTRIHKSTTGLVYSGRTTRQ
jgi:WhiB family redox-sensing transcriptional regulator